jgi:hypothetical protein
MIARKWRYKPIKLDWGVFTLSTNRASGEGKSQQVVTQHKCSIEFIPTAGIGEIVAGIEYIAANGWIIFPFCILQGSVHMEN